MPSQSEWGQRRGAEDRRRRCDGVEGLEACDGVLKEGRRGSPVLKKEAQAAVAQGREGCVAKRAVNDQGRDAAVLTG